MSDRDELLSRIGAYDGAGCQQGGISKSHVRLIESLTRTPVPFEPATVLAHIPPKIKRPAVWGSRACLPIRLSRMTFSEPYTPYCGLEYNDRGQPVRVTTAPHVAVNAPTRAGKTRKILGPAAVLHPGPVFSLIQTRFSPTGNPAPGQGPDRHP